MPFGGGLIRDTITHNTPIIFESLYPFITVTITFILATVINRKITIDYNPKIWFKISDSVGLIFFALSGGLIAIEAGFNAVGIIFTSLLTATGGGVLRDIALNEIPALFKNQDLYGTVALFIGAILYIEHIYFVINNQILFINMSMGLLLRGIVIYFGLKLPKL